MSSRTTTSGACSSRSLRNAHAISSADVAAAGLAEQRADRGGRGRVGREGVELLDHLDDRPVGDALAVGEAAAADNPGVDRGERLGDEPRLADACLADDRQQLTALLGSSARPGGADRFDFALAADEAALVRALGRIEHRDEAVRGDGLDFAFELERLDRLGLDRAADELERRLADQDLARVGRALEPGGDVDRVSGGEPLLGAGDDLARVHADPSLDAELGECRAHLDRGPAGAQRVVLVHRRDAEDGHHRVADELLHRAAVRLDDLLHPLEVAGEQALQRLRVDRLPERGRADHVAEENRDDLAVHRTIIPRRRRERYCARRSRSSARRAELRSTPSAARAASRSLRMRLRTSASASARATSSSMRGAGGGKLLCGLDPPHGGGRKAPQQFSQFLLVVAHASPT